MQTVIKDESWSLLLVSLTFDGGAADHTHLQAGLDVCMRNQAALYLLCKHLLKAEAAETGSSVIAFMPMGNQCVPMFLRCVALTLVD